MSPARRFRFGFLACGLGVFLLAAEAGAEVRYDMPKEELLKELGKPTSTLKHPGSGREVLNYPKGVRIEIEKGVVVSIKGLDMTAVEAATKAAAEQKAEAEAAAKLEQEAQQKIQAVQAAAAVAKTEKPAAAVETKGPVTMEQAVAAMEKREARAEHKAHREYEEEAAPTFGVVKFLLGQVVWFGLMIVALKLTTMYRDVDIEWSGLLIAAAADTGTRMVLALIAWFVFHAQTFFYLNQLIATGVLLLVLKKVSLNQTWQKAARVAFGVKVFMLALRLVVEKGLHFMV